MKGKYIFFDIDHTLVSHVGEAHIPPQTLEALRRLRDKGHVPAIATGRGPALTKKIADSIGIDIMICAAGAYIICGGSVIFEKWLPDRAVEDFLRTAELMPENTSAIDETFVYAHRPSAGFSAFFNAQAGYDCVRPLSDMKRALVCYIMADPTPKECPPFDGTSCGVALEHMRYAVEARAAETSKWLGIERVMANMGLGTEDVITFGDGPNDVDMLKNAPIGIAVSGGHDAALEAADFICGDIDDGGILNACINLNLI